MVAQVDSNIFVSPNLEGLKMENVQVERKDSILGAKDSLKINLPSMKSTISFETDLWIEFPQAFAYGIDN